MSRTPRSVRVLLACVVVTSLAAVSAARFARAASSAPATAPNGMVVSAQAHATRAGVEMLRAGGNAVDAAVATAFALGVTEPYHSGIGGGGFLLVRLASGEAFALDARETAPAAATREMFRREGLAKDASRLGPLSVATPGLVAGLAEALARWGTKPLPEALAPAIRLAEEGFAIGPRHARVLGAAAEMGIPARFPETARIQLPPGGKPPAPGWRLVQPELAKTLRTIAREGPDAFYRGGIAKAIAAEMERQGGLVKLDDLDAYRTKLREPVRGTYRGLDVLSFPPPSSGGVALVEALQVLEGFDLAARGAGSSASLHVVTEAMKLAFADRAYWLGDPDFVDVPVERLVSRAYADALRARIDPPWFRRAPWTWGRGERALRVAGPGFQADDAGTTHLSVTDAAGNAVAITQTVNLLYGSGITVPGTGIVLNDEMDDFAVAPNVPNAFGLVDVRGANAIAPGKRPLSSMTPTIVLKDGRPFLVTGSPGGPRIISTTLLSILNVVDYGMDAQEAVSAPRFHHQWLPDELVLERAIPEDVRDGLRRRGHELEVSARDWSSAQVIVVDPKTGLHTGGSDPRSDGVALGY
jgi:gamma-glutamyltranspeptidase/glutathione hydrolase